VRTRTGLSHVSDRDCRHDSVEAVLGTPVCIHRAQAGEPCWSSVIAPHQLVRCAVSTWLAIVHRGQMVDDEAIAVAVELVLRGRLSVAPSFTPARSTASTSLT